MVSRMPYLNANGDVIELHLGAAAQLSPIDTLRHVSFEWHDEHSVRLGIGHAHVNVGVV